MNNDKKLIIQVFPKSLVLSSSDSKKSVKIGPIR